MTEFVRAPMRNRFVNPTPAPARERQPRTWSSLESPDLVPVLQTAIDTYAHNPLAFVLEQFEWGKAGTRLADRSGPRAWQVEVLEAIGMSVDEDDSIVRVAIALG